MSNQRDLSNFKTVETLSEDKVPFFYPKNVKASESDKLPGEYVTGIYMGLSKIPSKYGAQPSILCFETNDVVRFFSHAVLMSELEAQNVQVGDAIYVESKGQKQITAVGSKGYGKMISSYKLKCNKGYVLSDAEKKSMKLFYEWEDKLMAEKKFSAPRPVFDLSPVQAQTPVVTAAKQQQAAPAPVSKELNPFA